MDIILPKIVAVGIYNTRFAVKNLQVTKNRRTAMFEIELPAESGGVSYLGDEEQVIRPNMVICAKPGQLRHTRLPFKCYYVHIILEEGELYDMLMSLPNFLTTEIYPTYKRIFEKLCKYAGTAFAKDELMVQSLILELIYTLCRDSANNERKKTAEKRVSAVTERIIDSVIKRIKENPSADLSLEVVAADAGFSPIYFHNLFKASTGRTLREFVEEQRIKKAADLLISTDKTLTEIAYDCGFSSQSYFSYAFKRKMNVTPREYAKKAFSLYDS